MPIARVLVGEKQRVPAKVWATQLDLPTEVQLREIAQLPFILGHVAAMPDAHLGKGSTVGCVIATEHAIIPAAVGVDIGCGMLAVLTNIDLMYAKLKQWELFHAIESMVPLGSGSHDSQRFDWAGFNNPVHANVKDELLTARYQLGTLGGGNHFIEISADTRGRVWIMLHSGSRKIGNLIAREHIKVADNLMKEWHIDLPNRELAYLIDSTPEFGKYISDLNWAQDYARVNREVILQLVLKAVQKVVGPFETIGEVINCHHNYTEIEHHYNKDAWVTRKGAIRARVGDMGIIPGSMGDKSYIVRGLGCKESFCSAPHGAGRLVPRKQADARFTVEDAISQTEGVACKKDAGILDEIPSAYKRIDEVIAASSDLVVVEEELKQFVCVKGG